MRNIVDHIRRYLVLLISMSGYVPEHATVARTVIMSASLIFSVYIVNYEPANQNFAFIYFTVSELLYIGFIMLVLAEKGLRNWLIRKSGNEEEAYLIFEAILGFLFFHNAVSIGYIASATAGDIELSAGSGLLFVLLGIPFITGFMVKLFAAEAVTIDIYYWKDMFLGRKISDFVVSGPYRYFSNPMYGIGQIQAYAAALWYGSSFGLLAAFLNQGLVFTFYFLFEKKFIRRIYLNNSR